MPVKQGDLALLQHPASLELLESRIPAQSSKGLVRRAAKRTSPEQLHRSAFDKGVCVYSKIEKPFILIRFGHGSYDRLRDRGFLHIGPERAEIWKLKKLTVPRIVMLGACETAAIAETHSTPANAWLAQGARAVLGTYFPVQADIGIRD
jgi:hypothetical protein